MAYTDQFAWLEDIDSERTKRFYIEHNRAADEYFQQAPVARFAEQLASYTNTDVRSVPKTYGQYTFWTERKAGWKKPKLLVSKDGEDRILLDYDYGDQSLDYWYPSPDGSLLIYGTSVRGNEQTTLKILDVDSGRALADEIPFAGFTDQGDICWLPGGSSFVYPRMNGFEKRGDPDKSLLGSKLYRHNIGDDPVVDALIFGAELPDTVMLTPTLMDDNRLAVTVCRDELTHELYIVPLDGTRPLMITSDEKAACFIKFGLSKVYVLTNYQAQHCRLLAADSSEIPESLDDWDEILPEADDVLRDFWLHDDGHVVGLYSRNVSHELRAYDAYGNQTGIIPLGEFVAVSGLSCRPGQKEVYAQYSGFTTPPRIARVDTKKMALGEVLWERDRLPGDNQVSVSQRWAVSRDGVKVPYFVITNTVAIEARPTIIYAYGGFNIPLEPAYLVSPCAWVLSGGAYVIANLRGGSEFGESWHRKGAMEHKQNTFNDCIAVAEQLVADGVATTDQIGVMGGSNGGLTVAAVTMQRPDLFCAGAALVPLTDMLEFYKHQIAEFWVHEYGDPRIPEQWGWIKRWSPYHYSIDAKRPYPAMLYETALHDARVHPLHAFKMTARLEAEVKQWKGSLLLRTKTDTGHQSANLSRLEAVRQTAEYYAFFARELGLPTH